MTDDSHLDGVMSALGFRMMALSFRICDAFRPLPHDLGTAGIREGMVIVDYGCGPGRYLCQASVLAGSSGTIYAVDIHPTAIETIEAIIKKEHLTNVRPVLVKGYASGLPGGCADLVYALDMFHNISDPVAFLTEIHRIIKPEGTLIVDSGHQKIEDAQGKILESGLWEIIEEKPEWFICHPQSRKES